MTVASQSCVERAVSQQIILNGPEVSVIFAPTAIQKTSQSITIETSYKDTYTLLQAPITEFWWTFLSNVTSYQGREEHFQHLSSLSFTEEVCSVRSSVSARIRVNTLLGFQYLYTVLYWNFESSFLLKCLSLICDYAERWEDRRQIHSHYCRVEKGRKRWPKLKNV